MSETTKPAAGTDVAGLIGRIEAEVRAALGTATLAEARSIIAEAGIRRARAQLSEAPAKLALAQAAYREAQAVEKAAREGLDQAVMDAEWALDANFHTDGNKTYLRTICAECGGDGKVVEGDGLVKCSICDGLGTLRKQMTADERRAYKTAEARKVPEVVKLGAEVWRAEQATAAARDAIAVAEKFCSAATHDVDAAAAELSTLAAALRAR